MQPFPSYGLDLQAMYHNQLERSRVYAHPSHHRSPHKRGTSALLVDAFLEGATAAGHQVERFDSAFAAVAPCKACDFCRSHGSNAPKKTIWRPCGPSCCKQDLVVLATPLYYFGFSAQLKAVLDRFYAKNASLRQHPKGSASWPPAGIPKPGPWTGCGPTTLASVNTWAGRTEARSWPLG